MPDKLHCQYRSTSGVRMRTVVLVLLVRN